MLQKKAVNSGVVVGGKQVNSTITLARQSPLQPGQLASGVCGSSRRQVVRGSSMAGRKRIRPNHCKWSVFSPDSRRVAYGAKRDGSGLWFVDGREGKRYSIIVASGPRFSPDSRRLAYVAAMNDRGTWSSTETR